MYALACILIKKCDNFHCFIKPIPSHSPVISLHIYYRMNSSLLMFIKLNLFYNAERNVNKSCQLENLMMR